MTRPHSFQKWSTARTWPGGGWGEAMAQVRRDQGLTQRDVAEYVNVSAATVRKWEDGLELPDSSLWPRVEEAMGLPVPDPRVPDHTPAERELIDTMLLLIDEVRLLRTVLAPRDVKQVPGPSEEAKLLTVDGAATYLGVSTGLVRRLAYERRLTHHKIGSRVMFRPADLERFINENKSDLREPAWQLRGRSGRSPRQAK